MMMTARQRAIKDRLRELEIQNSGLLTPDIVLKDAQDPTSVLHEEFEWDDAKAAHSYRVDQARELIRSVRYVEVTTKMELSSPNYVSVTVPPGNQRAFMSLDKIKQSKEMAKEAINL